MLKFVRAFTHVRVVSLHLTIPFNNPGLLWTGVWGVFVLVYKSIVSDFRIGSHISI